MTDRRLFLPIPQITPFSDFSLVPFSESGADETEKGRERERSEKRKIEDLGLLLN